ncbi:MAG: hypothetical protein ACI9TH_004758 [Kiritimatiellia bacterium]|jgi:hypothetical protein
MTVSELKAIMRFQLKAFNRTGAPISNATIHKDILSDDDGSGSATSKRLYKGNIRWTLEVAGHQEKVWPPGWMDLSVDELAPKLLA